MSTDYIHVIPENPTLIPGDEMRQAALSYFRSIAPEATEVRVAVSDRPRFILCYEDFLKVSCHLAGPRLRTRSGANGCSRNSIQLPCSSTTCPVAVAITLCTIWRTTGRRASHFVICVPRVPISDNSLLSRLLDLKRSLAVQSA